MRRSEADVEKLLSERIRIRLCKGAYKEPADIAFQKKSEVDASYVKLMKTLMKSGVFHGLATHDEAIIREAKAFATRENIPRKAFEFQMLHGIQMCIRDRPGDHEPIRQPENAVRDRIAMVMIVEKPGVDVAIA